MLWVTKKKLRIARAATAWLIRRFVDESAVLRFVEEPQVAELQEREGAIGFHAAGARYPALNARGQTAFEALVEEHCPTDAALAAMGRIVHDADKGAGKGGKEVPEAAGLRMITVGFPEVCDSDVEIVAKSQLLYDSLYYTLGKRARARGATGNEQKDGGHA
jgi:hypothetical protein